MSGEGVQPIDYLAVAATFLNQAARVTATIAPAFVTAHARQIELADEIAEDDCAVAGHGFKIATGIATERVNTG